MIQNEDEVAGLYLVWDRFVFFHFFAFFLSNFIQIG